MMRPCTLAALLFYSAGVIVRASDLVTPQEIRQDVALAIKKLSSIELGEQLAATATIQAWHEYAASAVPALTQALGGQNEAVKTEAAHALELIGVQATSAAPALAKSLQDPSPSVRAAAAFALAQIGTKDRNVLALLLPETSDRSDLVSLAALFAVVHIFPDSLAPGMKRRAVAERAVPLLLTALSEEKGYDSVRLARAIGVVDPGVGYSTVNKLIPLAESLNLSVASNTDRALKALGPSLAPYWPELLRTATAGNDRERSVAIRKLGWLRVATPASLTVMEKALSGSPGIQRIAAEALGRIGAPAKPEISSLAPLLSGSDRASRSAAAHAILQISPADLDRYLPLLERHDPKLAEEMRELRRLLYL